MDVFSNVVEGTRQYFLGLPAAQGAGPRDHAAAAGQPFWDAAPPPSAAVARSGAPATPASRPPSVACVAPPLAPPPPAPPPPALPDGDAELEPQPHIIHKATVMREAREKRREEELAGRDAEPPPAASPPPRAPSPPPPPPRPYHRFAPHDDRVPPIVHPARHPDFPAAGPERRAPHAPRRRDHHRILADVAPPPSPCADSSAPRRPLRPPDPSRARPPPHRAPVAAGSSRLAAPATLAGPAPEPHPPPPVSPPRASAAGKAGFASHQPRPTVSVTSIVNQMNQTKQKRESPLDLSVKTVKHSADSTARDDADGSPERRPPAVAAVRPRPAASHKVDFSPDFRSQYADRRSALRVAAEPSRAHAHRPAHTVAPRGPSGGGGTPYENTVHTHAPRALGEPYIVDNRYQPGHPRYTAAGPGAHLARAEPLNSSDDARKRLGGAFHSNVPPKLIRYETWADDSRIDRGAGAAAAAARLSRAAQEQHKLMSQPVYSYSSHRQFEAFHNEQRRLYRHYPPPPPPPAAPLHVAASDPRAAHRHVIQRVPGRREYAEYSGVPADRRVLSILRSSLETKHVADPPRAPPLRVTELIIIDDDPVTDLTADGEPAPPLPPAPPPPPHKLHTPRAVDSIRYDSDSSTRLNNFEEFMAKQKRIDLHLSPETKNQSPDGDVASRIRTKGELKGYTLAALPPPPPVWHPPPPIDVKREDCVFPEATRLAPQSQKAHLFRQLYEETKVDRQVRLETVIKSEVLTPDADILPGEVKLEPINIEEIEKDAVNPVESEVVVPEASPLPPPPSLPPPSDAASGLPVAMEDFDWASTCDSFLEQLKSGCTKKKTRRKRIDPADSDVVSEKVQAESMDTEKGFQKDLLIVDESINNQNILEAETSERLKTLTGESQDKHILLGEPIPINSQCNSSSESTIRPENHPKINESHETENIGRKCETIGTSEKNCSNKTKIHDICVKAETSCKQESSNSNNNNKNLSIENNTNMLDNKEKSDSNGQSDSQANGKIVIVTPQPNVSESSTNKDIGVKMEICVSSICTKKSNGKVDILKQKYINDKNKTNLNRTENKNNLSTSCKRTKILPDCIIKNLVNVECVNKPSQPINEEKVSSHRSQKKRQSIENRVNITVKEQSERKRRSIGKVDKGSGSTDTRTKKAAGSGQDAAPASAVRVEPEPAPEPAPTREQLQQIEKSVIVNVVDIIKSDRAGCQLFGRIKREASGAAADSSDDDEPLIRSKLFKEKHRRAAPSDPAAVALAAFVKLECCDSFPADLGKDTSKENIDVKVKLKQKFRAKAKTSSGAVDRSTGTSRKASGDSSSVESDGEERSVASRLRARRSVRGDDSGKAESPSEASPARARVAGGAADEHPGGGRKPGFGDGSDFHPGWEEEVYKYKRSLRMPSRLIHVPRSPWLPARASSSLPDLDPAPVSPAPSCAATLPPPERAADSDLDSNSSTRTPRKLHYDSEASGSTVFSFAPPRRSILDLLIQKYGRREPGERSDPSEPPTPAARFDVERRPSGAGFGDERPASAPPSSGRERRAPPPPPPPSRGARPKPPRRARKERPRPKPSSIRDGLRSTSLRKCDARGRLLRLKKRNDLNESSGARKPKEAGGARARRPGGAAAAEAGARRAGGGAAEAPAPAAAPAPVKRLRRLFARRKFSSGFDYIRKKKKVGRARDAEHAAGRSAAAAAEPRAARSSAHDVHKEIKSWFINKSVGETALHRAARLGYTDCAAYCLERLGAAAAARDNAGFTPLHVAAARGHLRIARLLLQYGADVSAAAQGGIRPLHEASENEHVETVRLLLAYGADPLLATYAGHTPAALAELAGAAAAAALLRRHVADVQGLTTEPWRFPHPLQSEELKESGCDVLASPPPESPPPAAAHVELYSTDAPLPPFYSLRPAPGTSHAHPAQDGLWCLLQDVASLLQIKSRDSLLKQIHCGAGSPRELLRELRMSEFLERAQCHALLGAGEKVNVRASKVSLVRLTDKLRQLLRIETTVLS